MIMVISRRTGKTRTTAYQNGIYRAVEGDKPLLHLDTDTNPDCGIGINIQFAIGDFYHEIQNMVDEKMKSITLQDIIDRYYFKIRKVKNL